MYTPQMQFSNCQNDAHSLFSLSLWQTHHIWTTFILQIYTCMIYFKPNQLSLQSQLRQNSLLLPKMDEASWFLDIPGASLQMGTTSLNSQAGGSMQKNHILNIYVIYCRIFPINAHYIDIYCENSCFINIELFCFLDLCQFPINTEIR